MKLQQHNEKAEDRVDSSAALESDRAEESDAGQEDKEAAEDSDTGTRKGWLPATTGQGTLSVAICSKPRHNAAWTISSKLQSWSTDELRKPIAEDRRRCGQAQTETQVGRTR